MFKKHIIITLLLNFTSQNYGMNAFFGNKEIEFFKILKKLFVSYAEEPHTDFLHDPTIIEQNQKKFVTFTFVNKDVEDINLDNDAKIGVDITCLGYLFDLHSLAALKEPNDETIADVLTYDSIRKITQIEGQKNLILMSTHTHKRIIELLSKIDTTTTNEGQKLKIDLEKLFNSQEISYIKLNKIIQTSAAVPENIKNQVNYKISFLHILCVIRQCVKENIYKTFL